MPLNIVQRELPDWGATYGPPVDGPFPDIMLLHGSEGAWGEPPGRGTIRRPWLLGVPLWLLKRRCGRLK
ncbi:hypothetical protein [Halomonas sp. A40-4]|uniref:hypothetical protein n=1 Tax=Halomonas sp. A40-4 TaxID=2785909 RepID=UPI001E4CABEA|nr:hypothetical protein [Halomonas sp. A40-4]